MFHNKTTMEKDDTTTWLTNLLKHKCDAHQSTWLQSYIFHYINFLLSALICFILFFMWFYQICASNRIDLVGHEWQNCANCTKILSWRQERHRIFLMLFLIANFLWVARLHQRLDVKSCVQFLYVPHPLSGTSMNFLLFRV